MNEHLAWQLLVTRPLLLMAAVIVIGLLMNGVALLKKEANQYQSKLWWAGTFVFMAGFHVAGFMYHHSFPHWALNTFSGLWVGVMTTGVLYSGAYHVLAVKMVRTYTLLVSVVFAIVANGTPLEQMLIDWVKKL